MKKKLITAIKALACVTGFVYVVALVYGLWTQGLSAMAPWILMGCAIGALGMILQIRMITRETDQILANMEAITGRSRKPFN